MRQSGQLEELSRDLARFAEDRDWNQFHNPKNLAMALSVEAPELVEIYQWLPAEQSADLSEKKHQEVREELGDPKLMISG